MTKENLTPKQGRFVEEYLLDGNATQAAIRAGYSARTPDQIGYENLRKPEIQAAIHQAQQERTTRTQVTADWVIKGLVEVAERCLQAKPVLDKAGHETGAYVFNAAGANRALELLGRRLKLFDGEEREPAPDFLSTMPPSLLMLLADKIREQEREAEGEQSDNPNKT